VWTCELRDEKCESTLEVTDAAANPMFSVPHPFVDGEGRFHVAWLDSREEHVDAGGGEDYIKVFERRAGDRSATVVQVTPPGRYNVGLLAGVLGIPSPKISLVYFRQAAGDWGSNRTRRAKGLTL